MMAVAVAARDRPDEFPSKNAHGELQPSLDAKRQHAVSSRRFPVALGISPRSECHERGRATSLSVALSCPA